ncbi:MAG: lysophospholipase [Deltaproteobacteria bacterium]
MQHIQSSFKSYDGTELFRQSWLPERSHAAVCLVHGAFEHSSRFENACAALASEGFAVHTFDLRGHGKSTGEITPESSFVELLKDVRSFVDLLKGEIGEKKLFMLGQSLGGALAVLYAADEQAAAGLSGLILCAPACKLMFPPMSLIIMYTLSKLFPGLKMKALEAHLVARDPAVARAYENDPLVNRQGIPVRPLMEFVKLIKNGQKEFEKRDLPLLVLHGTHDKVTDIRGSRRLSLRSVSTDKTFVEFPNFYHDLLNDPGKAQVYTCISGWISRRL